jgi:diguanylate cyclase (GGDEF)-like protein
MTQTTSAADFEASLRDRNAAALHVEVALGSLLVPAFWGLDWLAIPQHVWLLLGFRLGCVAYSLAILTAGRVRPEWTTRHVGWLSFSYSLLVAWSIALMCFLHEGYESPYYAGINLLILAVGLLFSWRLSTSIVFVSLVYLFYMAPLCLGLLEIRDTAAALGNQLFLISTMIITVTSQAHRRRLERREYEAQVSQQQLLAEVQHMATTDWLTSLYNRRHFFRLGEDEIERSRRYEHPISVLMIDIDHFKSINDTYGHSVGDQVLCAIAKRMVSGLRKSDIAGRYGGEEFAMVLPETDVASAASIVAERMREAVCGRPVDTAEGPLQVTVSIGVAGVELGKENLLDALTRADHGLYAAKRGGRNRVISWTSEMVEPAKAV